MKVIQRFACISLIFTFLFANGFPTFAEQKKTFDKAEQDDWSRIYFLGESTTAHLRRRGKVLGECAATNVLAPDCGTLALSSRTLSQTIRKVGTNEKISILDAIREINPPILILSFGLNGIVGFHANPSRYLQLYQNLIGEIKDASPETQVALQTIYPVAKEPTEWNFTASPEEVNFWIGELNDQLWKFAKQEELLLLDTAAVLKDEFGYLKPAYSADGIHLTGRGYEAVLQEIASKIGGYEG